MSKQRQFSKDSMPLTPAIFYILLSLAMKERHGYDIMKQVREDSNGKIQLGPGTLYGAIKRMLDEKLIRELDSKDARRRYYQLTEKGRAIMHTEIERYNDAVELARKRNIFSPMVSDFISIYG